MVAITIDTLKFSNRLKAQGFSEQQASAIIEAVQESDTIVLQHCEKRQSEYRSEFKADFERLEALIRSGATETKYEILKWTVPLIMGLYGLLIFKLF